MTDQPRPEVTQYAPPRYVPAPTKRSILPWLIPVVAVGGIALGAAGTLAYQYASQRLAVDTRLADAVEACSAFAGVFLEDENRTITIDVMGDEDIAGASYEDQACLLSELDVPGSVLSHISQTTSMDGRQTESWDGITIEWSYHPDRGSDMVITLDAE